MISKFFVCRLIDNIICDVFHDQNGTELLFPKIDNLAVFKKTNRISLFLWKKNNKRCCTTHYTCICSLFTLKCVIQCTCTMKCCSAQAWSCVLPSKSTTSASLSLSVPLRLYYTFMPRHKHTQYHPCTLKVFINAAGSPLSDSLCKVRPITRQLIIRAYYMQFTISDLCDVIRDWDIRRSAQLKLLMLDWTIQNNSTSICISAIFNVRSQYFWIISVSTSVLFR